MSIIEINLDEIPDRIVPITPGEHLLKVCDVNSENNDDGDQVVTAELEVQDEGEENGRKHWNRFNFKYAPARVSFKRFIKACGGDAVGSGVDPADLIGCTCRATFKSKPWTDRDTGEVVDASQISKFLYDAED